MRLIKGFFLTAVVLLLAVSFVTACGGKEERKARYLEKGKAYLAEKNYDKARIEFRNVLQIDPKSAEGFLYLAQVEEKTQNWSTALGNYQKAVELDPELIEPRAALTRFYMAQAGALGARNDVEAAAKAMARAQEQTKEIQTRDPENLEGLTFEAILWINDGDTDRGMAQLKRVLQKDAGLQSAAMQLANLYDQKGLFDEAESILVKAAKVNTDPLILQRGLAQLYRKHGKNDETEAVLRNIVENYPDELSHRVSLAAFLAQTEQLDKAEEVLRQTIAMDPEDAQRYILLSQFLATKRDKQAAIDDLKKAIQQNPKLSELQFQLVELYLLNEQKDEAETLLGNIVKSQGVEPEGLKARVMLAKLIAAEEKGADRIGELLNEVLTENPKDNEALLLRGKLAASKGDYVQAIGDFRSVLKDQPNSAEVLQLLAATHLANEEPELARDTLMRGIENTPDDAELRLSMAQLLLRGNDIDLALEHVDAVLKVDQYNERALKAKYELLARRGDTDGMEQVIKLLQAAAPDNEEGYLNEARFRFAQRDYEQALDVLNKVLDKNPESVPALLMKVELLATQKEYDEAVRVADQLRQVIPDSVQGYYLKGKLLQQKGDTDAAIKQYETALQTAPESVEVLAALVKVEAAQDGGDKAEQRLLAILEENPQHRSANDLLGAVYLSKKDFAKAEKAFERQLEINADISATYSRLAQTRIAQDNLAGALAAIEQGLKVLPDNPQLLTGLAGMQERQKDYEAAIATYEQLLEKQPNNAIGINNLAALLSDHRSDAVSLDKAAEMAGKLEKTQQPAFRDTAGWIYYRKGEYGRAVEILKGVVDQAPEVPVFRYHLGMAYLKLGDKSAASEHLTRATDGDYSYQGVEEAQQALKDL